MPFAASQYFHTSVYHPQTGEFVDQCNQMLQKVVTKGGHDWDLLLL